MKLHIHIPLQAQRLPEAVESVTDCSCPSMHELCWAVFLLGPASGDVSVGGCREEEDAALLGC